MSYDNTLNLAITVTAADKASAVISSIVDKLSGGSGLTKALVGVGLAAGTLAVGLGASAVDAASKFGEAGDLLVAHAGLAQSQLNLIQQSLLQMGPQLGQMPTALEQAIYPVLSGFSGISNASDKAQLSLTELKLAGESVAGSTTNISDVTSAATATFNAFGMQTANNNTNIKEMNTLFDEMNTTITLGNQQWSDFSNVAGKLAVSAKAAHLSLTEAYAAESTLTNEGYSARLATTYLGNTFNELEIKTASMAKHAAALGINFNVTKFATMDLGQQIQYLNRITGGNQSDLLGIFGGNSVALRTFDALTTGMGSYQSNLQALNQSHGATGQAFGTTSQGFGFKVQQAQAALQSLSITVGNALLPVLTPLLNDLTPMIGQFGQWLEKSGALKDITQGTTIAIHDLGGAIQFSAGVLGWIIGEFQDFFSGLQQGDPWVSLLVGGITAIGTAIGLIKLEEWAAGWYNTFVKMQQANGIIAGMADKALPNLGQALGWTQRAAQDTAVSVESIGTAAVTAEAEATSTEVGWVDYFGQITEEAGATGVAVESIGTKAGVAEGEAATAAAGMTGAFALATGAISISFGILAGVWLTTQQDITTGAQKMSADVQKAYDALGNSAADNAAKAQITQMQSADNVASEANVSAGKSRGYWVSSYYQTEQASKQAKEQMIADQAKIADAAVAAAQKADGAWVKASQDMSIVALLQQAGWTGPEIQKYLAGTGTNTNPVSVNTGPSIGQHHASGILNNPVGHWATVGEQGPEVMYVPQGASIFPHGSMPGGTYLHVENISITAPGGNPQQISVGLMDAIERELARRFRTQTSGFSLGGLS